MNEDLQLVIFTALLFIYIIYKGMIAQNQKKEEEDCMLKIFFIFLTLVILIYIKD